MKKIQLQPGVLVEALPKSIGLQFTVWSTQFTLNPEAGIKLVQYLEEMIDEEGK